MDEQQSTKMPKPFENPTDFESPPLVNSTSQQFEFKEEDKLKQEDDYRQELGKIQDEIVTLRQVLSAKLKRENELKTLLGIGFVEDLKQDWNETVHDIKSTNVYQKTAGTLHAATEKISPVVQTVNTSLKSRLGSLRNSNYFKTFETTLGSTVNAVKSKMSTSKSTNFRENNSSVSNLPTSATHSEHLNFNGDATN